MDSVAYIMLPRFASARDWRFGETSVKFFAGEDNKRQKQNFQPDTPLGHNAQRPAAMPLDAGSIRLRVSGSRLKEGVGYASTMAAEPTSRRRAWAVFPLMVATLLTGCALEGEPRISITATPQPPTETPVAAVTLEPTSTLSPYPWSDENAVMGGICFEAALDASGQVFVLRSVAQQIEFYDLADNSRLCRRPVTRYPFDFSGGRVLAGLWSAGRGCTARHDVLDVQRDDTARRLTIRLRFVTEGDCNYELVQPFWIGLEGVQDYAIEITNDPPAARSKI